MIRYILYIIKKYLYFDRLPVAIKLKYKNIFWFVNAVQVNLNLLFRVIFSLVYFFLYVILFDIKSIYAFIISYAQKLIKAYDLIIYYIIVCLDLIDVKSSIFICFLLNLWKKFDIFLFKLKCNFVINKYKLYDFIKAKKIEIAEDERYTKIGNYYKNYFVAYLISIKNTFPLIIIMYLLNKISLKHIFECFYYFVLSFNDSELHSIISKFVEKCSKKIKKRRYLIYMWVEYIRRVKFKIYKKKTEDLLYIIRQKTWDLLIFLRWYVGSYNTIYLPRHINIIEIKQLWKKIFFFPFKIFLILYTCIKWIQFRNIRGEIYIKSFLRLRVNFKFLYNIKKIFINLLNSIHNNFSYKNLFNFFIFLLFVYFSVKLIILVLAFKSFWLYNILNFKLINHLFINYSFKNFTHFKVWKKYIWRRRRLFLIRFYFYDKKITVKNYLWRKIVKTLNKSKHYAFYLKSTYTIIFYAIKYARVKKLVKLLVYSIIDYILKVLKKKKH